MRAELLRFLALSSDESGPLGAKGIRLTGAWITGPLDFEDITVNRRLALRACRIQEVLARQADLRVLDLTDSFLKNGLKGESLRCRGSLFMRGKFRSEGEISLLGAHIGGNLEFTGGQFEPDSDVSLRCTLARIEGSVFCSKGFRSVGAVRFVGARIGGGLYCEGASMSREGGIALSFENSIIAGPVLLGDGFKSVGEVRLVSANIGGVLSCDGGEFHNPSGQAVSLELSTISGSVYLRNTIITGGLRFTGANVGGNIELTGAKLMTESGRSINGERAIIAGSLFLKFGFESQGQIRLNNAKIGGSLECDEGSFKAVTEAAIALELVQVSGSAFFRNMSIAGGVRMHGCKIGGNFECIGSSFVNESGQCLNTERALISGHVFLRNGFRAAGEVRLAGASIEGDLDCAGGRFENTAGPCMLCHGVAVSGNVYLRDGFSAKGTVNFAGATVARSIECTGGLFDGAGADALVLNRSIISGSVMLKEGFHARGAVRMQNVAVTGDLDCHSASFDNPGGEALICVRSRIEGGLFFRSMALLAGKVDLSSTRVGTLHDDQQAWAGAASRLVLDGFIYGRLSGISPTSAKSRVAWLSLQPRTDLNEEFRPQPWEQLSMVLRTMGHADDARLVALAKHGQMRKAGRYVGGSRLWDFLYGALVGYGYRPRRLMSVMLAVWLICAVAYWAAVNPVSGRTSDNLIRAADQKPSAACLAARPTGPCPIPRPDYSNFVPLIYSADVLLPVVDLGYQAEWQPVVSKDGNPVRAGQLLRFLYWFEIVFGWIASLLLVGVLSNLIKKD